MTDTGAGTQPRLIAVEGPIGVGKTSLAVRLSESLGGAAILEQPADNPFLRRFYKDPAGSALPTQLFFLFQRVRQVEALRQSDLFGPVRVMDYVLAKDRLFARMNLNRDELELYNQIYARVVTEVPSPDLVVYLQAPFHVLLRRIARRGVDYERMIGREYLTRLAEAYARYFHHYNDSPLLIVNVADIDFVNREADYQQLLDEINNVRPGRHFFNPVPGLL